MTINCDIQWENCHTFRYLPTAYVVRREGNVLTRVCPLFCLSTPGGGTLARSRQGWYPSQVQLGGYPCREVPHLRYPPSDLAEEVPLPGGYAPVRPSRGVPPAGRPHPQVPPSDLARGNPTLGIPPSDLARGYPLLGISHLRYPHWTCPGVGYPRQTWLGGTPARGVPHLGWST